MEPSAWPLVRDHDYKILVVIGYPYSITTRRFHEAHVVRQKYYKTARSIELLNVNLDGFMTDKKDAPYDAELKKHNTQHAAFRAIDVESLDKHMKALKPGAPSTGRSDGSSCLRFIVFNHHSLMMHPELIDAAYSIVLVTAFQQVLYQDYNTTNINDGFPYYQRCVYPGVQVSSLTQAGLLAAAAVLDESCLLAVIEKCTAGTQSVAH
jgi:hypothetical protein